MRLLIIALGLAMLPGCLVPTGFERPAEQKITIESAEGDRLEMGADQVTEAEIGVPFYPNSREAPFTMKIETPKGKMILCYRETNDSVGDVVNFYAGVLDPSKLTRTSGSTIAKWTDGRAEYMVSAESIGESVTIVIAVEEWYPHQSGAAVD